MIRIMNMMGSQIELLWETREFMLNSRSNVSQNVKKGLNYNIILISVLILEGQSEELLYKIVNQYQNLYIKNYQLDLIDEDEALVNNAKILFRNSFDIIKQNISKNTGIRHYLNMFNILLPECRLSKEVEALKESIQILYQFRNVLAHGRAVQYEQREYFEFFNYDIPMKTEISFDGGYYKVQEYLIKKKLIDKRITEIRDTGILFSDEVSNHFVYIQKKFIKEWRKCVPFELKEWIDEAEKLE